MNPYSYDEIYRTYATAVFRVCLRGVSRREIAEELTSEVFLALHESWATLGPGQLPAWLFTVAKRRCADYWRRRYVEESWSSSLRQEVLWSEPEHSFADILARCTALKPIHRICLTLRFMQGMSRAEIAQQTSLSELQVKGHLQYGLQLLRQLIQPDVPKASEKGGPARAEFDSGL